MQEEPCKWRALSIGALLGNLEGVRLKGFFREKETAYLGSFFCEQEGIKFKSGGHLEFQQVTVL